MGPTNRVQPYYRLAIRAMQTMPSRSLTQQPRSFAGFWCLSDSDVLLDCRAGTVARPFSIRLMQVATGLTICLNA
jgi:hypothetical protein